MSNDQLHNLLKELVLLPHESEWVEFKENNYGPEEISRLISALSNTACTKGRDAGYLVFGVKDETHEIVGTTFNPLTYKVGQEPLEIWLSQRTTPKLNVQIFRLNYEGKNVVIIEIPSAKDRSTLSGQVAYIRIGSVTKPLIEHPDHERIIWNNPLRRKFETESALSGLNKQEVLELLDSDSFFRLSNLTKSTNEEEVIELLESEGLIAHSRGAYSITNLGAILFAKKLSNFNTIKRKAIRIISYSGNDRVNTIQERIGQQGYASAFQNVVAYINGQLPSNEAIQESIRIERKIYPEIAIRELVANALVHQDFTVSGNGPMVEIFSDRLEIYNPGTPLVNTDRFIDYPPRSRNEILASLMRRVRICEERGSGIDKVISAIEVYQLPAPRFETYDNGTRITIYAPRSFANMDRSDRIRACYQHCCLNYVSNRDTTNSTLRQRLKISEKNYPMVSRIFSDTTDAKFIKPFQEDASKKNSKYIPIWA